MDTYITLNELKTHLNIETGYTEEDIYLQDIISVAEMAVYNYLNGGLSGETIDIEVEGEYFTALPKDIKHAILILCSTLYLNRTAVSFGQGYKLPYSFDFLLGNYRNYTIK